MLVSSSLRILRSWDLYLNIWSILADLFLEMLLLALRTVKVLHSLVGKLKVWGTSDGQVNVLSGAAPGGPSSSF